jgi:hypothetical protein
MSGDSQKRWTGRTLLALVLCILAISFAMEAKMAWYLPPHTLGSEVQAAKALPANTPQLILHGLPNHNPMFPLSPLALLLAVTTGCLPVAVSFFCRASGGRSPVFPPTFTPPNFFRPPPVR